MLPSVPRPIKWGDINAASISAAYGAISMHEGGHAIYEMWTGLSRESQLVDGLSVRPFCGYDIVASVTSSIIGLDLVRQMGMTLEGGPSIANVRVGAGMGADFLHGLTRRAETERPVTADVPRFVDANRYGLRSEPPLASVIWRLVEDQHVNAARELLAHLPNEPQHERMRTLLRPPTTSTSPRRDRDRARGARCRANEHQVSSFSGARAWR